MTLDYITLGIYFVFLLVIGGIFAKFNKNMSDFVRGGGRITWWMAGTSVTMAGISAFTFTGNGSAAYIAGPTLLAIYAGNLFAFLTGALFIGPWARQTRALTTQDIYRERFGTVVEQFGIYFSLPLAPIGSSVTLYALAVFVSTTFGFPMEGTILVIGGIVVAYAVSGGSYAIMATDFVQGVVLYVMTILLAVLALMKIGGIGEFFSYWSAPEFAESFKFVKEAGEFPGDKFTWSWIITVFFMQAVAGMSLASMGRYLSVKDGREARLSAWWGFFLMAIGSLVWFIPPMVARFTMSAEVEAIGGNDPATSAYAVIARDLLPTGMMGVMIAAMFSATMSSLDGGISGFGSTMVRNVIGRYREWKGMPELSDKMSLILLRSVSLLMGICVILAALFLSQLKEFVLFDAFLILGSVVGIPMTTPLIAGLLIRRLPAWGYFAILGGALLPSIYTLIDERFFEGSWNIQERVGFVLIGAVVGTIVSVIFRDATSQAHKDREKALFEKMSKPVDFEKEIGGANDASQALILGRIIACLGGLVMLLLLIPNPASGRLIILITALAIMSVGGVMILAAKRTGTAALDQAKAQNDGEA